MPDRALIIVDLQKDFLPGGALAVPRGDEIIEVINRAQTLFELVVATQDWHPANHVSFAVNHPGCRPGDVVEVAGLAQALWPVHCVQNTPGAELSSQLDTRRIARVFHKGVDPGIDSYSAFFDNAARQGTGLAEYLRAAGVGQVFLAGLATEFCVAYTARDALRLGFSACLIVDACRGLDVRPGDVAAALTDLEHRGVCLESSCELAAADPQRPG